MKKLIVTVLALVVFAPTSSIADTPAPVGHSTVHIVFIASHSQQMMGAMGGAQTPMARVGDLIVPANGIRPIRITIDGDFVGHALVGSWDIKPVFVLAEGHHEFTFAIDGFDPIPAEITVLGRGSKQYLIVKLPSEKSEPETAAPSVDATVQPSGK